MRGPAEVALETAQVELVAQLLDAIDDLNPSRSIVIGRSTDPDVYVVSSHPAVARAIRAVRDAEAPAVAEVAAHHRELEAELGISCDPSRGPRW